MKLQNSNFQTIEQLQDRYLKQQKTITSKELPSTSFQEILQKQFLQEQDSTTVKFSKHASNRMSDRNIELTDNQMERLNEGMGKASQKGINESLVLIDSLAFIVNVPSKTVITAMDQKESNENIFTNIDGAVII